MENENYNYNGNSDNGKHNIKKPAIIIFAAGVIIIIIYLFYSSCIIVPHKWTEATCTEPKTCERCGETEGTALGHTFSEYTVAKEPTCTENGSKEAVCSVCGYKITEDIPKTEHTYSEYTVVKNPTCTEAGSKEAVCSVCGDKKTENIQATGHTFNEGEIVSYATLYTQGEKKQTCTKCGATANVPYELTETEKANINLVMTGILDDYPSETIGNAFNGFFANPIWSAEGNFVAFNGECTWGREDAKATIGFEVSGDRFELGAFNIGGYTFDNYIELSQLINTIYNG